MDTTATAPARPAQVELTFNDAMRSAVEHAFAQAQHKLTTTREIRPYTTILADDGFDIQEHAGHTVDEVYASVRALIAQRMPDFYVLTYDGFIETPTGVQDAITCEIARRGDASAQVLALPYTVADDEYTFRGTFGSAGLAEQLYPSDAAPAPGASAQSAQDQAGDKDDNAAAPDAGTAGPAADYQDKEAEDAR